MTDTITGQSVVNGKLHFCGGEPGLKSRDGAQLTVQSAKCVAVSLGVVSRLVVATSLCGVGENILEKMCKESYPL